MLRRISLLITAALLLVPIIAVAGLSPVTATGVYPTPTPTPEVQQKCNAGNDNEGCDPGQSVIHNKGGDEIGCPVAEGGSSPNPGENNVGPPCSP
jgi:hypothetical protein